MGTKVTLPDVENLENNSGLPVLNTNLDTLSDEFDKVLYRDGSFSVTGDIDFDSNRLLNLPYAVGGSEPVSFAQFLSLNDSAAVSTEVLAARDEVVAAAASVDVDVATVVAAKDTAVAAANSITSTIPSFSTVALGIAGVADGEQFRVDQGVYDFIYSRQGTSANFEDYRATTTAALDWEGKIEFEESCLTDAGVPTDGIRILATTAHRWGGRLVQNVNSAILPSLNAVDAFFPRDEEGNTTPTRTISANLDPLGNFDAVSLNYTSTAHNLEQIQNADDDGILTPYTLTVSHYQKSPSGGTETMGLGSTSRTAGNWNNAALTASWAQVFGVFSATYDSTTAYDIGYIPASGTPVPFDVEYFGQFIGLDTGPLVIPSLTSLKDEQEAGHGRPPISRPGLINLDTDGWITPGNAWLDNILIPLGRENTPSFTIDAIVEMNDQTLDGTFHQIVGFTNTPDTGTSNLPYDGQIAMYGTSNAGDLYTNPNLSDLAATASYKILGNGPTFVSVTAEQTSGATREVKTWVYGIPIVKSDEVMTDPFEPEYLTAMGQELSRKRRQVGTKGMKANDRLKSVGYVTRARDATEQANIMDAAKRIVGSTMPDIVSAMGSWDSLTAFSSAPFMQLKDQTALQPGFLPTLEGEGGSRYGSGVASDYINADRQAFRRERLQAMARNSELPIWFSCYGRNDLVGGVMDPVLPTTDANRWQTGRDTIDALIVSDVASIDEEYRDKVVLVLCTVPPAGDWNAGDADANDIARETARLAYNQDCRDNYLTRGYDYLVDWEDGTYIPGGFTTLLEAAVDGYENGANGIFDLDGIHWQSTGGIEACQQILVPKIQEIKEDRL